MNSQPSLASIIRSLASLTTALALMLAVLPAAQAEEGVGDLGLSQLDQPASSPSTSGQVGIGLNATLAPSPFGLRAFTPSLIPAFSLRVWLDRFMLEPLFGLGILAGDSVQTLFLLNAGILVGYALSTSNLRAILGGGMVFGLVTGSNFAAFTFGPLFGLEYRFRELPNFGLEAALFLPFQVQFEPGTIFTVGTAGSAIAGFHYYF